MQFSSTAIVSHPPTIVLDTMIERMEAIVPFLPNIDSITTSSKTRLPDGRLRIVRRWQGSLNQVPLLLRPFASPEWLAWIDTALWTPAQYKVDWTHSPALESLEAFYDCSGTNFFEPHPDEPDKMTRMRITGALEVYPQRLPGVPQLLGQRLAPQIESFLIGLVTPNLTALAHGLQRYLDTQPHAATNHRTRGRR